jgi:hypothetical protein
MATAKNRIPAKNGRNRNHSTSTRKPSGRTIMSPVEAEYLSVEGCERLTNLSRSTWRRYAYAGTVASCKVGGRLIIPRSEVNRILQGAMRPALATAERN